MSFGEVPYSGQSIDGEVFMIVRISDLNCDVEHCTDKNGTARIFTK